MELLQSHDIESLNRFENGKSVTAKHLEKEVSIKEGKVYYDGVPQGKFIRYADGKVEFKDWYSRKRQVLIKGKF
jgi:hypothetical protein